jgi:hypothetical protein
MVLDNLKGIALDEEYGPLGRQGNDPTCRHSAFIE